MDRTRALAILRKHREVNELKTFLITNFKYEKGTNLRRGVVLDAVTEEFGYTVNVHLHHKIRTIMESLGGRHIKIDGRAYWGDIAFHSGIGDDR